MLRSRAVGGRIAFYGVVLFVLVPLAFSQVLLGTYRQPARPPIRGWQEVRFPSEGLTLRGWLAPPRDPARAFVVVAHGVGDSLESFTEIGTILGPRGHGVLLFDFRGHGGSEGRYTTLGGHEREDVRAALRYLRQAGHGGAGFILMGHSMGAVAVLRAAALEPDLRAVVAEAPYDNYRASIAHHAKLYYRVPGWLPLVPLTIAWAEWRAGFRADDVDAVAAAREVRVPLLAIADGADLRMPEAVVRRVFDAHRGPKQLWVAPGADHVGAILNAKYWPTVLGFLEANGL